MPATRTLLWIILPPFFILYILYVLEARLLFNVSNFVSVSHLLKLAEQAQSFSPPSAEVKAPDTFPSFTRHIVAVGDLHGDLPNARKVLHFSGVVDDFGDWTGHADYFVQTGDIIDR